MNRRLLWTFQSTPPVWGATGSAADHLRQLVISIHAPRVGGDGGLHHEKDQLEHFNPRPPCGGRHDGLHRLDEFKQISIHAPRVGGDDNYAVQKYRAAKFQSTPPVWGATRISDQGEVQRQTFQSTPPVWGATFKVDAFGRVTAFQSTPPVWGAT